MRLLPDVTVRDVSAALAQATWSFPVVAANVVTGPKFYAALPPGPAPRTIHRSVGQQAAIGRSAVGSRRAVTTLV